MKPMLIDEALHVRLEDWAWWVSERTRQGYKCLSAEGRYRPPRVVEHQPAPRVVDAQDAALIERVICHPGFPAQARGLLVGWYVLRASRSQVCRRCGVTQSAFDQQMGLAGRILKNRLDIESRASLHSPNNSIPPLASNPAPWQG